MHGSIESPSSLNPRLSPTNQPALYHLATFSVRRLEGVAVACLDDFSTHNSRRDSSAASCGNYPDTEKTARPIPNKAEPLQWRDETLLLAFYGVFGVGDSGSHSDNSTRPWPDLDLAATPACCQWPSNIHAAAENDEYRALAWCAGVIAHCCLVRRNGYFSVTHRRCVRPVHAG